jgi:hypothetical protein
MRPLQASTSRARRTHDKTTLADRRSGAGQAYHHRTMAPDTAEDGASLGASCPPRTAPNRGHPPTSAPANAAPDGSHTRCIAKQPCGTREDSHEWHRHSCEVAVDPGALWRIQTPAETEAPDARLSAQPWAVRPSGAAQESNLPTVGLPRPAGFEVLAQLAVGERFGGVSAISSGIRIVVLAPTRRLDQPAPEAMLRTSPVQSDPPRSVGPRPTVRGDLAGHEGRGSPLSRRNRRACKEPLHGKRGEKRGD